MVFWGHYSKWWCQWYVTKLQLKAVFSCNWMALNKNSFFFYYMMSLERGMLGQSGPNVAWYFWTYKRKTGWTIPGKHLGVSSLFDQNAENSIHPLCPWGQYWLWYSLSFGNKYRSYPGGRSTQSLIFLFFFPKYHFSAFTLEWAS